MSIQRYRQVHRATVSDYRPAPAPSVTTANTIPSVQSHAFSKQEQGQTMLREVRRTPAMFTHASRRRTRWPESALAADPACSGPALRRFAAARALRAPPIAAHHAGRCKHTDSSQHGAVSGGVFMGDSPTPGAADLRFGACGIADAKPLARLVRLITAKNSPRDRFIPFYVCG